MKNIPFMNFRLQAYAISLGLVILSLFSLFYKGLNLGLDFTGGSVLEVKFGKKIELAQVRKTLQELGYTHFQVQDTAGGSIIVKLRLGDPVEKAMEGLKRLSHYELIRSETVGGVITSELRQKALWAILVALGGILVYIGYRFEFIWGLGAILALVHDVLIVVGAYSLTGREVNLDVVAALLIVAGYSVSDTVVVFDRIRENMRIRKGTALRELIDISVNQTLSRTIMTSLTTLLVSFTLFLFGGPALSNIMFAFVVGVVVGTFSSIFVASAIAYDIRNRFRKQALQSAG